MKKSNTPMECDLKGLFKSTVEETKLKEKYTVSSIWKKSFRDLYYQFQFRFSLIIQCSKDSSVICSHAKPGLSS